MWKRLSFACRHEIGPLPCVKLCEHEGLQLCSVLAGPAHSSERGKGVAKGAACTKCMHGIKQGHFEKTGHG